MILIGMQSLVKNPEKNEWWNRLKREQTGLEEKFETRDAAFNQDWVRWDLVQQFFGASEQQEWNGSLVFICCFKCWNCSEYTLGGKFNGGKTLNVSKIVYFHLLQDRNGECWSTSAKRANPWCWAGSPTGQKISRTRTERGHFTDQIEMPV